MSVRMLVLGTLSAAALWPAVAAAQERRPSPDRVRVYVDGPQLKERMRAIFDRRARLGVFVDLTASDNDSIGATIQSVTPGGPAAKAGIRSGDIITRFNGKSLVENDDTKASEDESPPGVRLVELASQLKTGDTVSIEFRRGTVRRTVSLVTSDEPRLSMDPGDMGGQWQSFSFPKIDMERLPSMGGGAFAGPGFNGFAFMTGGPLMDLELAPLNPDLGAYFGTTDGVLVISAPKESTLGLKGGDVILSVDGRKVSSTSGLMRILRSYEPEDTFKLEVMRNKARTTVTGKLDGKEREQ